MKSSARFPTHEEAEANPALFRNDMEVQFMRSVRLLPRNALPSALQLARRLADKAGDVDAVAAAIEFFEANGWTYADARVMAWTIIAETCRGTA